MSSTEPRRWRRGPASERLTVALVRLASDDGYRPPCGEFGKSLLFTSDDSEDRRQAAPLCATCRVRTECHDAAEEGQETFGVWAGLDRSDLPTTTRSATTKETP